jgi:hypothetical protein
MIEAIMSLIALMIAGSAAFVVYQACSRIVDIEPDLAIAEEQLSEGSES